MTLRVLIAADKFKGSLTAVQVAERVTAGLRRVVPGLEVEALPVADGGDGTVDAAVAAGFERHEIKAAGPLGQEVTAAFALRGDTDLPPLEAGRDRRVHGPVAAVGHGHGLDLEARHDPAQTGRHPLGNLHGRERPLELVRGDEHALCHLIFPLLSGPRARQGQSRRCDLNRRRPMASCPARSLRTPCKPDGRTGRTPSGRPRNWVNRSYDPCG